MPKNDFLVIKRAVQRAFYEFAYGRFKALKQPFMVWKALICCRKQLG
jgi:hypothetical protein